MILSSECRFRTDVNTQNLTSSKKGKLKDIEHVTEHGDILIISGIIMLEISI